MRPSEGIAHQFFGMMTAFTNTSDPELLYSHCWQVKTRVFNCDLDIFLIKSRIGVFRGSLMSNLPLKTPQKK